MRRKTHILGQQSGFTIVELLIVIVVIAILASIVIVAYNGIQTRAMNTAKHSELMEWNKLYELYKAENGAYPIMPDGGYCLGTGFPDTSGDGVGDCRDIYYAPNRYSENTTLKNMILTAGSLPSGPRDAVNGTMGPYVEYHAPTFTLMEVIKGSASDCPGGASYIWDDGAGMLLCGVTHNES